MEVFVGVERGGGGWPGKGYPESFISSNREESADLNITSARIHFMDEKLNCSSFDRYHMKRQ